MGGFSWNQLRQRGIDRQTSLDLRREMMAQERDIQGTFEEKRLANLDKLKKKGKQDRLTQELRNKGQAATQTIATVGAGQRQDTINTVAREKLTAEQGLVAAKANRWNAGARKIGLEADAAKIALPYADRMARQGVNLPLDGQTFSKVGGAVPALPGNTIPSQPYIPDSVDVNQDLLDRLDEEGNINSGLASFGSSMRKKKRNLLDDLGYADSEFN